MAALIIFIGTLVVVLTLDSLEYIVPNYTCIGSDCMDIFSQVGIYQTYNDDDLVKKKKQQVYE